MSLTRRKFLLSATAVVFAGNSAMAQDDPATQSVIRQLESQGFSIVSVRRTLLGRVRIVARRGDLEREIVLDPRNGVVLRDYTAGAGGEPSIGNAPGGGSGSPAGGEDDDDDDDDDDDGDGDDESGDDGGDGDDGDDGGDDEDD